MKSIKVCEYSRSRSFHYDLILQDQASGERSQDQWSSGFLQGTVFLKTQEKTKKLAKECCFFAQYLIKAVINCYKFEIANCSLV